MPEQKQSIKVSKKLRQYLLDRGTKSDSFEDVIWRLIGTKKLMKEDKKALPSEYEDKLNTGKKKK